MNPVFSIAGHGFGHGVGLSQWGAEERAVAGQGFRQILSFYYPGTTFGTAPASSVRVLVADSTQLTVGARAPFSARDATGHVTRVPAGMYAVGAGAPSALSASAWPIVIQPGTELLQVGGLRYHGSITLERAANGHVLAVNTVGIEDYIADVVSAECPAYWRPGALRAQAVASRTYAVANLRPSAPFDLYPDDRSQNYHGATREFSSARAAARSTTGDVLLYDNKPAYAMFSASNGGLTSALSSVPYFVTRRDPFDARSPDADWGPIRIGLQALRRAFPAIPSVVTGIHTVRNRSDRVVMLTFEGTQGPTVTIPGRQFQERLGLRSTYFSLQPAR